MRAVRRLSKPFANSRRAAASPVGPSPSGLEPRFDAWPRRRELRAFTVLELLVVMAIIAILVLCVMRAVGSATDRANVVRCIGNLRNLHVALNYDVIDEGHWPQCPFEAGEAGYDEWWVKELGKYHISEPNWQCPTLLRNDRSEKGSRTIRQSKLHYMPAQFDDNPATPRRWARQPWLIEVADAHGEGNLIVFPDGAIIGSDRYLSTHQ